MIQAHRDHGNVESTASSTGQREGTAPSQCIFCKGPTGLREPIEHIIPESLGCPAELILRDGEVCGGCNNRLSKVDGKLIERFQIPRALHGSVITKKGKRPSGECGNIVVTPSSESATGVELEVDIAKVGAGMGLSITLEEGPVLSLQLKMDESVSRGLHKIALEYVCFKRGRQHALQREFDDVRSYVLRGPGHRFFLMEPPPDRTNVRCDPPCELALFERDEIAIVEIVLFNIRFWIGPSATKEELVNLAVRRCNEVGRKALFMPDPTIGPREPKSLLTAKIGPRVLRARSGLGN